MEKEELRKTLELIALKGDLNARLKQYGREVDEDMASFKLLSEKFEGKVVQDTIRDLEEETRYTPLNRKVTVEVQAGNFEVHLPIIIDEIQDELVPIIYYIKKDIQRLTTIGGILLGIGNFVLIFGGLLSETIFFNSISSEVYAILSWIFIWTGVERLLFDRRALQYRIKLLKRLFHAKYILVRMTTKKGPIKDNSND
ncbi:MAG: hypothetical protein FJ352_01830 [Firmicutes bacterium]|nr:hypothetical protein [Bacillota bacterium]